MRDHTCYYEQLRSAPQPDRMGRLTALPVNPIHVADVSRSGSRSLHDHARERSAQTTHEGRRSATCWLHVRAHRAAERLGSHSSSSPGLGLTLLESGPASCAVSCCVTAGGRASNDSICARVEWPTRSRRSTAMERLISPTRMHTHALHSRRRCYIRARLNVKLAPSLDGPGSSLGRRSRSRSASVPRGSDPWQRRARPSHNRSCFVRSAARRTRPAARRWYAMSSAP
jgi:hypothetical protein